MPVGNASRLARLLQGPAPKPRYSRVYRVRLEARLHPRRRHERHCELTLYHIRENGSTVGHLYGIELPRTLCSLSYSAPHTVRRRLAQQLGVQPAAIFFKEDAILPPVPSGLCQHCWHGGRRAAGRLVAWKRAGVSDVRDLCADHIASAWGTVTIL